MPSILETYVQEGEITREEIETVKKFVRTKGGDIIVAFIEKISREDVLNSGPEQHLCGIQDDYQPILLEAPPNPDLTFDSFVHYANNHYAYAVSKKIAGNNGDASTGIYYIYGDTGLGKTHLLSAIANHAEDNATTLTNTADLGVEYERAKRFCFRAEFRKRLTSPKLLLIDDIQICKNDHELQYELLAIINGRLRDKQTTVFSSTVPIGQLEGYSKGMISVLKAGICVQLQVYEKQARREILRRAFGSRKIPKEIIDYLSENVVNDVRKLKAAADQIITISEITGSPLNMELARVVAPLPADLVHEKAQKEAFDEYDSDSSNDHEKSRATVFKEMLETAENEEEQALALQIALSDRLREIKAGGGHPKTVDRLERALELLREGKIKEACAVV